MSRRSAKATASAAIEKARAARNTPAPCGWGYTFDRKGRRILVSIPPNEKRKGGRS